MKSLYESIIKKSHIGPIIEGQTLAEIIWKAEGDAFVSSAPDMGRVAHKFGKNNYHAKIKEIADEAEKTKLFRSEWHYDESPINLIIISKSDGKNMVEFWKSGSSSSHLEAKGSKDFEDAFNDKISNLSKKSS